MIKTLQNNDITNSNKEKVVLSYIFQSVNNSKASNLHHVRPEDLDIFTDNKHSFSLLLNNSNSAKVNEDSSLKKEA